ncbi:uncharacterized protein LOC144142797 isoform X3 [Haemaphysalis longicornis]
MARKQTDTLKGLVPSTLYNLQCCHKLCRACFYKEACYICPMDNTRSEQYKATTLSTFNSGLIKTTLECPLCCTVLKYLKLEEHLKTDHPDMQKMHPSTQENKLPKRPRATRPPPGFGDHVSPGGRGRGLLSPEAKAYPGGYEQCARPQVPESAELASLGTRDEAMETEEAFEAADQPAGDEILKGEKHYTTGMPCVYCTVFLKDDQRKEHLEYCFNLFIQWKELIVNKVFHDCQETELDWHSKSLGHMYTCPVLDLESKRSFILMTYNYSRGHYGEECGASTPGSSFFQEHIGVCAKFSAKCSKFVSRVVDKYRREHSSNGCPENKKTTGIPETENGHFFKTRATSPHGITEHDAEDTDQCPNCFVLLKLEDVADHADKCPELRVCEKCYNRVVAKYYGTHLEDECPANKQTCTSSQVDEGSEDQTSTKPASYGAQIQAHDFEEGASPCPYCETLWGNKDLQEHIKNCQRDQVEALNSPSGKIYDHKPVNALFQESKPDTRFIKETEEGHEKPMETEDDVEALKKRVEELEHRIKNLERPLKRLIERLRNKE